MLTFRSQIQLKPIIMGKIICVRTKDISELIRRRFGKERGKGRKLKIKEDKVLYIWSSGNLDAEQFKPLLYESLEWRGLCNDCPRALHFKPFFSPLFSFLMLSLPIYCRPDRQMKGLSMSGSSFRWQVANN